MTMHNHIWNRCKCGCDKTRFIMQLSVSTSRCYVVESRRVKGATPMINKKHSQLLQDVMAFENENMSVFFLLFIS